mgnify:CR=1 FL=1
MTLSEVRCLEILTSALGVRVLVLGDMVIDEHIIGRSSRLSREAPVPVIEQSNHLFMPGGAANLAYNAQSLGAEVSVCGLIGDDEMGDRLCGILDEVGIETVGLVTEAGRPTGLKRRLWAGGEGQQHYQQIARVDLFSREPMADNSHDYLMSYLQKAVPESAAMVISDYESGAVDPAILNYVLPLAKENSKDIIVDSHGRFSRFRGVTAVTPNQLEAEAELGRPMRGHADLQSGGNELRKRLACKYLMITLGGDGLAIFSPDDEMLRVEAHPIDGLVDATGAGDTVASAFTLALLTGASPHDSARIANAAAATVVSKLGAATARPSEVASMFGKEVD